MKKEIAEKFGGRLRVRVCGILIKEQKVLMVKHRGLGEKGYLWSPPGGGVQYQTTLTDNLKREFLEETGLQIEVEEFLFINEFHRTPLHALELFFKVREIGGSIQVGYDPEMEDNSQIIEAVSYWGIEEFKAENGPQLHTAFQNLKHTEQLLNLNGYFQNWK